MVRLGSKPEVLFNDHTSAFTSSGHATALVLVREVPILLQKWEMRESKRRLGVEARFWLPLAPLGAVASKQLH